jgi:hypothetical protein
MSASPEVIQALGDVLGVNGSGASAGGVRARKRKPRNLSLTRRLALLRRCITNLAARERNTLRRMSRVRHIHDRLELAKEVKPADIGQMIMEALDERTGNVYQPLTAADRAAMTPPVVEWLIPNAIPSNDLTIVGGRAKVGKTRLAMYLTKCLLRGEDFLGFGEPPEPRTVILVTDDQADGDTADMLQLLGLWDHPGLIWSRRFRLTANNIDRLLLSIKQHPGAVVVIDSLRSITRSTPFSENDPEIGALIYDLKQSVLDVGGSLALIHHCNKSNDLVGVEALSGHNSIPGSANTVLTLHYLTEGTRQLKNKPERRLVVEGRSTPPADLVVSIDAPTCTYALIGDYEAMREQAQEDGALAKDAAKVRSGTEELKAAMRYLQARFTGDTAPGAGLLDICKIIGVADADCKVIRDMSDRQLTAYKKLDRNLSAMPLLVIQADTTAASGVAYKTYALTPQGAEWVAAEYNL